MIKKLNYLKFKFIFLINYFVIVVYFALHRLTQSLKKTYVKMHIYEE